MADQLEMFDVDVGRAKRDGGMTSVADHNQDFSDQFAAFIDKLPQGWTAVATSPTEFTSVAPGTAPAATFQVTPPSYAPNASAVVHTTATLGNMTREAGVTVTVP